MTLDHGQDDEAKRLRLAQQLRQAREYVGISQEDVSKALGIPRPAVTNIESGSRRVEAVELDKLSRLYGRPVQELLGLEAPQAPQRIAFLARATQGLTDRDMQELAKFAEFLKSSSKTRQRN